MEFRYIKRLNEYDALTLFFFSLSIYIKEFIGYT